MMRQSKGFVWGESVVSEAPSDEEARCFACSEIEGFPILSLDVFASFFLKIRIQFICDVRKNV